MLEEYVEAFKRGEYETPLDALKDDVFTDGFLDRHTRPELIKILQHLYRDPDGINHVSYSRGMCKKRMEKHIRFWFELHQR